MLTSERKENMLLYIQIHYAYVTEGTARKHRGPMSLRAPDIQIGLLKSVDFLVCGVHSVRTDELNGEFPEQCKKCTFTVSKAQAHLHTHAFTDPSMWLIRMHCM